MKDEKTSRSLAEHAAELGDESTGTASHWADLFAAEIAKHFGAYIGEPDSENNHWAEALEVIKGAPWAGEAVGVVVIYHRGTVEEIAVIEPVNDRGYNLAALLDEGTLLYRRPAPVEPPEGLTEREAYIWTLGRNAGWTAALRHAEGASE